jgi:hypothetical protein|tara:strand:- start:355 stop:531 length:177 start_codon:yes stop_codon:yes gene_type:complete
MDCKYCGYRMNGGKACDNSPSGKCVGVPDSNNCVYCTYKFVTGAHCLNSPTEKHQLAT